MVVNSTDLLGVGRPEIVTPRLPSRNEASASREVGLTEPRDGSTLCSMEDAAPFSVRSRLGIALVTVALCLASLLGLAVYRFLAGPALSAAETAAELRSYTAGDPDSYTCRRLWLDHWDYRCSFTGASGDRVVVDVRVNGREIVSQTAP
jgi:hypothetical protein